MIRLGLVQATTRESLEENLLTLARFAGEAAREGCEALCLPECFLTGYHPEQARELAVSAEDPVFSQISRLAEEYALDILVGFMERSRESVYITHGLFRRDGEKFFYRKTHLGKKEATIFSPGDTLEVFGLTCGLRMGFQLCVETHYPEITQTLALKGAQVIFAPHAVPRVSGDREAIWRRYIPARAYDNRVYLLCCNLWDEDRFAGGCLAADPRGDVIASCFEEKETLAVVSVERELVADYHDPDGKRAGHFFPVRRRPELYTI